MSIGEHNNPIDNFVLVSRAELERARAAEVFVDALNAAGSAQNRYERVCQILNEQLIPARAERDRYRATLENIAASSTDGWARTAAAKTLAGQYGGVVVPASPAPVE